jgi:hypothetical protein
MNHSILVFKTKAALKIIDLIVLIAHAIHPSYLKCCWPRKQLNSIENDYVVGDDVLCMVHSNAIFKYMHQEKGKNRDTYSQVMKLITTIPSTIINNYLLIEQKIRTKTNYQIESNELYIFRQIYTRKQLYLVFCTYFSIDFCSQ